MKRALSRLGVAAIAARMTEAEVERDPVRAMTIAMDAMRATLGLPVPPAVDQRQAAHEWEAGR